MDLLDYKVQAERIEVMYKEPWKVFGSMGKIGNGLHRYHRHRVEQGMSESSSEDEGALYWLDDGEHSLLSSESESGDEKPEAEKDSRKRKFTEEIARLDAKRAKLEPKTAEQCAKVLARGLSFLRDEKQRRVIYSIERPPPDIRCVFPGPLIVTGDDLQNYAFLAEKLWPLAQPSLFGDQTANANRLDLTVRDARELKDFEFDPGQFLLPLLKHRASDLWGITPVVHTFQKMTLYGPGGHFKQHVDHVDSAVMLGTCAVVLPGSFKGGAMKFGSDEKPGEYDYEDEYMQIFHFYGNEPHEVLEVTEGIRVALTFSVALDRTVDLTTMGPVNVFAATQFFAALHDLCVERKKSAGFVLQEPYARKTALPDALQPADREFVMALKHYLKRR